MGTVLTYFQQVKQELAKVTWPTREQTIQKTLVVVIVSIGLAVYLAGTDFLLQEAVKILITK